MPCLQFSPSIDTLPRAGRSAMALGRRSVVVPLAMLAWMTTAASPTLAATGPSAAVAPATGETEVVARARAWLAQAHQVSPSAITVQAPDARLPAGACASGWAFDRPFPQNETVLRARCPDTQWQLFLSVGLPRAAVPAVTAGTLAPPAPARTAPAAQPLQAAAPAAQGQPAPVAWTPPAPPTVNPAPSPAQAALPLVVRRGHTVVTTWTPAPGLSVSARLESLDDGRVGDMIRVRNRDTGRILGALVSGQGQAVGQ